MKFTKLISSVFIILFMITTIAFAQQDNMMQKDNMKKSIHHDNMMNKSMIKIDQNSNGVAIDGYDPVAYFEDSKAEMGMSDYSYEWMGAKWQFKNKSDMELFKNNPEKYAPGIRRILCLRIEQR